MADEQVKTTDAAPPAADATAMAKEISDLRAKLAGYEKPAPETKSVDSDLLDRARSDTKTTDQRKTELKRIESALKFDMSLGDFVKNNADLLPGEIAKAIEVAGKETYDSAVEKAGSVKSAMIQSFFSIQYNVDALTPSQKASLDDFMKLTKNGKEQRAEFIFENIFEPTFEMVKRIKKAEELGKSKPNFGALDADEAYKQKLLAMHRPVAQK